MAPSPEDRALFHPLEGLQSQVLEPQTQIICLFEVTHHPVRAGIDCPYEKRKIQANNFLKMYPSISNTSLVFAVSLVVIMLTHC